MPAARPSKALIARTLEAWQAAGLAVGGLEVRPDGTLRVLAPEAIDRVASTPAAREAARCDELFGVSGS